MLKGSDAYLLRSSLAGLAEKTIDLQYFIWEDDLTGRMMLHEILRSAERGVRVRLLLDDVHTKGDMKMFHLADAHPRVEVRLFNPFPRNHVRLSGFLFEGSRLNRRMHNKVMIADNAVFITGGRNIGDHYFAVDQAWNFRDLDLLAAGPVVVQVSSMFDAYWNSKWAYPVSSLEDGEYSAADVREWLASLEDALRERNRLPYPLNEPARERRDRLEAARTSLVPGEGRVVFDPPEKVEGDGGHVVAEELFDSSDGVREELLIETAYFIPGDQGVEILASLVERGVDVRVLTNSLATNDIVATHAGYMPYREALLRGGVDLYELRPDALAEEDHQQILSSPSIATLHTKVLVYDRHTLFIGSFNLDPRSLLLNTEIGVLIKSPALARDIAKIVGEGMSPANSYRLKLADGDICWQLKTEKGTRCLEQEPETSWWKRMTAWLISLMPLKGQL